MASEVCFFSTERLCDLSALVAGKCGPQIAFKRLQLGAFRGNALASSGVIRSCFREGRVSIFGAGNMQWILCLFHESCDVFFLQDSLKPIQKDFLRSEENFPISLSSALSCELVTSRATAPFAWKCKGGHCSICVFRQLEISPAPGRIVTNSLRASRSLLPTAFCKDSAMHRSRTSGHAGSSHAGISQNFKNSTSCCGSDISRRMRCGAAHHLRCCSLDLR